MSDIPRNRLPVWLNKKYRLSDNNHNTRKRLRERGLHTVCEEARCPNIGECFERGVATIMIMGNICTRHCSFCAVRSGKPLLLDPEEPARVAEQVREMRLKYAVVTSVTRDDLPDGGAGHFAATVREVRCICPETKIEVLVPDFKGRAGDIQTVCKAGPDVLGHNIETVERLTPLVRDGASYRRSLGVLSAARRHLPSGAIKSGLMIGLGERRGEVEEALRNLKAAGCDIATIGQYLRPSRGALPVVEYIDPETFCDYKEFGLKLGFKYLLSSPFVRSSYLADKVILEGL